MTNFQKIGGVAALCQGAGLAFLVFYFLVIRPADYAVPARALQYANEQSLLVNGLQLTVSLFFDFLSVVTLLALYDLLLTRAASLVKTATAFGMLGLFLFFATGLLGYFARNNLATIHEQNQLGTENAYLALNAIQNALSAGAGFALGWWIILLSWAMIYKGGLPKLLGYFGLLAGLLNVLSLFGLQLALFFNVVWFLWLGFWLIKPQHFNQPTVAFKEMKPGKAG